MNGSTINADIKLVAGQLMESYFYVINFSDINIAECGSLKLV
jgi:hypothetical protein